MALLKEFEDALRTVAERAGPSVVRVGGGWRGGSGVVVEKDAVLTNAHNVRGERVSVTFADGRQAEARVAGMDVDGDLAVLAVETADAPALTWAADAPAVGSVVFGVVLNGSGPCVTMGYVSSVARQFRGPRGRPISGSVEHTAPLVPGSSGSALVDGEGRLVALNTNRLGGGFYLALPADAALRAHVASLQRGERVERPRLGVGIAPPGVARRLHRAVGLPERDGLLVRAVEDDSPAERAGIEEGDLIVEAAGRPLRDIDDLYDVLREPAAGGSLALRLVRGADERTVEVRLEDANGEGAGREDTGRQETGPVH